MPWTRPTLNDIYQRIIAGIESRLTGGAALLRYAVLRILAKVFAGEFHLNYGYFAYLAKQLFVDTAESVYLDRWAYVWGITRKPGSFSNGYASFTGVNDTSIPAGTQIQSSGGVIYETLAEGVIAAGTVTIAIQCIEIGPIGNLPDGTALQLLSPSEYFDSEAEAVGDITGGSNIEGDKELLSRILQRIQEPPMGGSKNDYVRWALEATDNAGVSLGCTGAWCFAPEDAPEVSAGIVRLVIKVAGADPVPGDPVFIDNGSGYDARNSPNGNGQMYNYIAARKPVTAALQIWPIDPQEVQFDISITPYSATLAQAVEDKLEALFETVAMPGGTIYISQLRDAIMNSGVRNYNISNIDINTVSVPIADIVLTDFEYPIYSGATITSM